jgi:hypothetical protein
MNESEVHSKIRIWEGVEDTPEEDKVLRDGGFEIEKVDRIISVRVEKRVLVLDSGMTVDSDLGLYQCWPTIMWPQNTLKINKDSLLSDILQHLKSLQLISTLPFWTDGKDVWQVRPIQVIWTKEYTSKQLWDMVFNDEDRGFIRRVIAKFDENKTELPAVSNNVVVDRFGRFIIS